MKRFRIVLSIWLTGAAPMLWAQHGMPAPQETTPGMGVDETRSSPGDNPAAPSATSGTRSTGRAGDTTTHGVSGPDDGASGHGGSEAGTDTSGGSGSSGASAAAGGSEDEDAYGSLGSSSANPGWQGIGSTGGATGTGESIGTTDDGPGAGSARPQPDPMR